MIHIIYASTSGNVEVVCEEVSKILTEAGFENKLYRSELTNFDVISNNEKFILATSTWEHGEINPFFEGLLLEIKKNNLAGKYAAFIGLGDLRYEPVLFCGGVEVLTKAFVESGGMKLGQTLKINGEPYKYLDTAVKTWTERIIIEFNKI